MNERHTSQTNQTLAGEVFHHTYQFLLYNSESSPMSMDRTRNVPLYSKHRLSPCRRIMPTIQLHTRKRCSDIGKWL